MLVKIKTFVVRLYEYIFYLAYSLFGEMHEHRMDKMTYSTGCFVLIFSILLVPVYVLMLYFEIKQLPNVVSFVLMLLFFWLTDRYFSEQKCKEIVKYFTDKNNARPYKNTFIFLISACIILLGYRIF